MSQCGTWVLCSTVFLSMSQCRPPGPACASLFLPIGRQPYAERPRGQTGKMLVYKIRECRKSIACAWLSGSTDR